MANKWECKTCGHIGYPEWVHNDEKCEVCFSGQIVELSDESTAISAKHADAPFVVIATSALNASSVEASNKQCRHFKTGEEVKIFEDDHNRLNSSRPYFNLQSANGD